MVAHASRGFHPASRRMARAKTRKSHGSKRKKTGRLAMCFGRDARNDPREAGATAEKNFRWTFQNDRSRVIIEKSSSRFTWEEHPEYQKFQAKIIGILVLLGFALYIGYSIKECDWDLLENTIKFGGAFVLVLAAFPMCAWLIVLLIKKARRTSGSSPKHKNDV
jgi:hypothetical protein